MLKAGKGSDLQAFSACRCKSEYRPVPMPFVFCGRPETMVYARSDAFGMHIFVHGVFCVYMQSGRIPPSGIPGRLFCFIGNSVGFPMKQKASGRMRSSRKGRSLRDSARARRVRGRTLFYPDTAEVYDIYR